MEEGKYPFVGFSREEYAEFLDNSVELAIHAIEEARFLLDKEKSWEGWISNGND